jgi:hypothetical protein
MILSHRPAMAPGVRPPNQNPCPSPPVHRFRPRRPLREPGALPLPFPCPSRLRVPCLSGQFRPQCRRVTEQAARLPCPSRRLTPHHVQTIPLHLPSTERGARPPVQSRRRIPCLRGRSRPRRHQRRERVVRLRSPRYHQILVRRAARNFLLHHPWMAPAAQPPIQNHQLDPSRRGQLRPQHPRSTEEEPPRPGQNCPADRLARVPSNPSRPQMTGRATPPPN